jgi:hypothetical protein
MKIVETMFDRRNKRRFAISREMRYKLLRDEGVVELGNGETIDIGSGGISFTMQGEAPPESYVELSISWPVLLDDTCAMRLIIFGRLLRSGSGRGVCTIDKYEFRTQAKALKTTVTVRNDSMLLRWAQSLRREENLKTRACAV